MYEYLRYQQEAGQRFVVRVEQDRSLAPDPGQEHRRLYQALALAPEMGRLVVQVPQRGGRPAREALVGLRAKRLRLNPPPRGGGTKLPALRLNAVRVEEIDPPPGEAGLSWLLYTSEPIDTPQQVGRVMGIYRLRWRVEDYHKCWKSGTKVERLRLQSPENLRRLGTILAHVAVRVLQLHDVANDAREASKSVLERLAPEEWQCLWKSTEGGRPLPPQPPTLGWAACALGRLGGWGDTKRTGRIGFEALWRGWLRLQDRLIGWQQALSGVV